MQLIKDWFVRRFSNPQILILTVLVVLGFAIVLALGSILSPLFAAVIIAYLFEGIVVRLERWGLPRILVVSGVFLVFVATLLVVLLGIVPLLSRQVTQLVQQLPAFVRKFQDLMLTLPERYPELVSKDQIDTVLLSISEEIALMGQKAVAGTLASITGVLTLTVFLVLVPILVFFLMKDKPLIVAWVQRFLPRDRHLATSVWREVDIQLGNYVRGKTLEILLVGVVSFIAFRFLGLEYAVLLATLVGFSVIIPYIGAAVVTLPVVGVAFFQFGWTSSFAWVFGAYLVIQILDGNALVPLLFSEVVNLHPVAIIVAVLFFGGIWGFWGVFFAIPLATLFNAMLRAFLTADDSRHASAAAPQADVAEG